MDHYLQELVQIPSLQHVIGPVYCDFQIHLRTQGAHIPFPTSIQDLYLTIKQYGVAEDKVLLSSDSSPDNLNTNQPSSSSALPHLSPSVHQTIIPISSTKRDNQQSSQRSSSRSRYQRSRSPRRSSRFHCDICFGPHPTTKYYLRGDSFVPKWLLRNRIKYIATHPEDKPDPAIINADPPLRRHRKPMVNNILQHDPDEEGYSTAREQDDVESTTSNDLDFVNTFPTISNTVVSESTMEDPFALVQA